MAIEPNGVKVGSKKNITERDGLLEIGNTYMGIFDIVVFKVIILGLFGALVLIWPVTPKWLLAEQNGLNLGLKNTRKHIWSTFALAGVKVIYGVFWCICLKISCNSKRWPLEQNRLRFWTYQH